MTTINDDKQLNSVQDNDEKNKMDKEMEELWMLSNLDARLTRRHMLDLMESANSILQNRVPTMSSLIRVVHACKNIAYSMKTANGTPIPGKLKKIAVLTCVEWCIKLNKHITEDVRVLLLTGIDLTLDPLVDFYVELDVQKNIESAVSSVKSCCIVC